MNSNLGLPFGFSSLMPQDPYQDLLKDYYDPKAAKWNMAGSILSGLGTGLMTRDWAKAAEVSRNGMNSYRENAMKRYTVAQMMQAADEKKRQREEEAQKKQLLEEQISQLDPKLQGLARIAPEKVFGNLIDQQFPDPQGGGGADEFGLAPVALSDKNGKFVGWGQMSKSGGLYYNGNRVDGNGEIFPMDPYSSNQMKSAGTAAGKEMGGAAAAIPGAEVDTQAMNDKIDLLRDNPNLADAIGYGNALGDYFVGNDVLSIRSQLNELEGGAFLSAYSSLKGGGQITEIESAQAKQAMADMQTARKMSDVGKFKEALERFRGAVNRGMEKLRKQAGPYAPGGAPAAGDNGGYVVEEVK